MVTERPDLRIIEQELHEKAQEIMLSRGKCFKLDRERQSNKYLFSTLIKCRECGWSFRRTVRTYKNTYVRWVCSGHNGLGADNCPNAITVDEEELIAVLEAYFVAVLKAKKNIIRYVVNEFNRTYKLKSENESYGKELKDKLSKLERTRQKYMDMYTDDLISRDELNSKIGGMRKEIERLENELHMVELNIEKGDQLEELIKSTFSTIESITDVHTMTNAQLKKVIQKILVDKDGNVDIYLRLLGDLGLDEAALIELQDDVIEVKQENGEPFDLSTTVHKDLSERLPAFNRTLYLQVKQVLDENKAERHIRGGIATRNKYRGGA